MVRPFIRQPMPGINEPFAVLESGEKVYPTEVYRRAMESENEALFGGDGSEDVTQGISEGGVQLGTGTIGDYVQSLSGAGNVIVTGGTGEGSTPQVSFSMAPTFTGLTVSGNIVVTGTIDGRDPSVDGAKLDGIESGATADQTAAEIRTLVENASDSNVFTDADHTKLNGIATGATANATDAALRDRATHTGSQAISTVTGLQTALDGKVSKTTGITDASTTHALNATFDDTEVEAALDALGSKINEVIDALNA